MSLFGIGKKGKEDGKDEKSKVAKADPGSKKPVAKTKAPVEKKPVTAKTPVVATKTKTATVAKSVASKETSSEIKPKPVTESMPTNKEKIASSESLTNSKTAVENKVKESSAETVLETPNAVDNKTSNAKFSIGIDLGTTHCVLSHVDLVETNEDEVVQGVLSIPQLTSLGEVENKSQLPSFMYLAHEAEITSGDTSLPWAEKPEFLVGEIARNMGAKTPIRLVASAKSWLSHADVDCKKPILPADAPNEINRVSPFQATYAYLQHLVSAWNTEYPHAQLAEQDITLTVPASFDPAARELTVEAAKAVGLDKAVLLEEPQAALYSWIEKSEGDWRNHVKVGDIILVADVGGGTTDLSLIAVTEKEGNLELTRVAVGDHILLGGDNMDLALAYTVKAKIEKQGKRLQPWQVQALTHSCRDAKEKLFNDMSLNSVPLVIANRGSSLIGGSLRTDLTRTEVRQVLVEGFLPKIPASERPVIRKRAGLRTSGLPYAQDAGITRHLAAFLAKQLTATEELTDVNVPAEAKFLHPTAVLLNGGVFKAPVLAQRLMNILNTWLDSESAPHARLLEGADLDLAVARGAAYYGHVRKGKGVRIKGGTAASYYVGVESAMPAIPGLEPEIEALCIAPFGMEEGTEAELPADEFGLVIGEAVRFRFFASNSRREDKVGTRLDYWTDEELQELSEIEVTLPEEGHQAGEVIPVLLRAAVTEVGTLALHAVSQRTYSKWKIEFDVRAGEED